jgi:hypothetical protein
MEDHFPYSITFVKGVSDKFEIVINSKFIT